MAFGFLCILNFCEQFGKLLEFYFKRFASKFVYKDYMHTLARCSIRAYYAFNEVTRIFSNFRPDSVQSCRHFQVKFKPETSSENLKIDTLVHLYFTQHMNIRILK